MIEFIQQLQQRYKSLQRTTPSDSKTAHSCTNVLKTLSLAEVSILKQQLALPSKGSPLNLVVFGPTQAGKSTLVNYLLPEPLAGVSPLAGYTVHPQGFVTGLQGADIDRSLAWLKGLFPGFKRYDQEKLDHSDFAAYSLTELTSPTLFDIQQPMLIWDTPDFDSIDAHGYIDSVLRTIGLADILILTVSKEKYADQSVWNMLELLAPLSLPLLICINKLGENEEQTLFRSFLNRYKSELPEARQPQLASIPFLDDGDSLDSDHIIQKLNSMIGDLNQQQKPDHTKEFIEAYWQDWIQPVREEIQDDLEWQNHLQTAIDSAMQNYRSEFLDHPDYYDTFQRALAELLDLLEIPGFGESLGKAREVITWPMRKLINFGKSVIQPNPHRSEEDLSRDKSYEEALLRQLVDEVITKLANDTLYDLGDDESHSQHWKQALRRSLNQSRATISAQFEQQISTYQSEFDHEIQAAAKELYLRLEDQPVLLNSLRAARVTTDAAAIVFALHSGGISLHDFILAPAMLSLSSMLAESSMGQYLNTVKARLKTRQYEAVENLFVDHLQAQLNQLRDQTAMDSKFQITENAIKEIEDEFFGA